MNTTSSTSNDLEQHQWEREITATNAARAKAIEEFADTLVTGNIDRIGTAQALVKRLVPAVIEFYDDLKDNPAIAGAKRGNIGFMQSMDSSVMAAITVRTVLRIMLERPDKALPQYLMEKVGKNLWLEYLVQEANRIDPTTVFLDHKRAEMQFIRSEDMVRRIMRHAAERILSEHIPEEPTQATYVYHGKHGVDALYSLGVLELKRYYVKGKTELMYILDPEVESLIVDQGYDQCAMLSPTADFMVCPPKAWGEFEWGGYLTPSMMNSNPVVETDPKTMQRYRKAPLALATVNYLQGVAYTISPVAVDVVRRCWELGGGIVGLPKVTPAPKPVFPFPEDWDKTSASEADIALFKDWCRAMNWWYTGEIERKQKVLTVTHVVKHLMDYSGQSIWCPVFLDWRGRAYYRGRLNPQGSDFVRAAFVFQQKKRLGTRGIFWLKVHIANSLGFDKPDFKARAKWVEDNWDALVRGSEAPWDYELFRDSGDYPVTACVAIRELVEAYKLRTPEDYESGIPVHMDATCSGQQIFAGVLRDTKTALTVNVKTLPNGERADIYTAVKDKLVEILKRDPSPEAKAMLALEPDRNLTKKPCMTIVYGATFLGINDGVYEWLADKLGKEDPTIRSIGLYNTKVLIAALKEALPAVSAGMDFLKQVCRENSGKPVSWYSPMGFVVEQGYKDINTRKIKIMSAGVSKLTVVNGYNGINPRRMSNGISPNVIHTLDAALMAYTMREMREAGLECASIHDSFGTHPADVDFLHKAVRRSYVKLFEDHDALEDISRRNGVDCTLKKGDLDVKDVLNSQFFFS